MRFDFSKQQQSNSEGRRRLRMVRTLRLVSVMSPVAAAAVLACAGALLVFAAPPDARWIDALTWQSDGRARLARHADEPSSVSDNGRVTSGRVPLTDPALSVIDVALHQG